MPVSSAPELNPETLGPIYQSLLSERQTLESSSDSFDGRSGVLLGFAGVLLALSAGDDGLSLAAFIYAALAVVVALWALWPRPSASRVSAGGVYERLKDVTPQRALDELCGVTAEANTRFKTVVTAKSNRLKLAALTLVLAAVFGGLARTIDTGGDPKWVRTTNSSNPSPTTSPRPTTTS